MSKGFEEAQRYINRIKSEQIHAQQQKNLIGKFMVAELDNDANRDMMRIIDRRIDLVVGETMEFEGITWRVIRVYKMHREATEDETL